MVTTTAWIPKQQNSLAATGQATIDAGETATLAIPCGGRSVVRIGIPTITSANLTFNVVPYPGATARLLKNEAGSTVTVTAGTGNFVVDVPELSGVFTFTIISSATQVSAVAFDVQCVGDSPALALTNNPILAIPAFETAIEAIADITSGAHSWTTGNSPITVFTVTGSVLARVYGVVSTPFTSTSNTGTAAIGVTGATGALIAASTANGSTNFIANASWVDSTPTTTSEALPAFQLVTGNIIVTIATNSMTAGGVTLYCDWIPVPGTSGLVVAA